jgi:hypothetical protein
MAVPAHLRLSAVTAIADWTDRDYYIDSRSLKQVAPQPISEIFRKPYASIGSLLLNNPQPAWLIGCMISHEPNMGYRLVKRTGHRWSEQCQYYLPTNYDSIQQKGSASE